MWYIDIYIFHEVNTVKHASISLPSNLGHVTSYAKVVMIVMVKCEKCDECTVALYLCERCVAT